MFQKEISQLHHMHKAHYLKLKEAYKSQTEKLLEHISTLKASSAHPDAVAVAVDPPELEDVPSIVFDYDTIKLPEPRFETAEHVYQNKLTMTAEEHYARGRQMNQLRSRVKELEAKIQEQKEDIGLYAMDVKLYKQDLKKMEAKYDALVDAGKGSGQGPEAAAVPRSPYALVKDKALPELPVAPAEDGSESSDGKYFTPAASSPSSDDNGSEYRAEALVSDFPELTRCSPARVVVEESEESVEEGQMEEVTVMTVMGRDAVGEGADSQAGESRL